MKPFLSTPIRREFFFLILLPFLAWVICFWSFIFGPLPDDLSGVSYGEKTVFLMTSIFHGIYPLWDPGYYNGFPFEFFLRRIGDGNPFYLLVAFAKLCGASDIHAYRFFLMFYYFLAVTGFWLICRHVLRHRLAYIGAYLLLLFSGWGARAFSDYILLIFVPLVWFFYFLIVFLKEGKRHQFLGIFLATAIAITTYIPFFFLTVVGSLFISSLIFFGKEIGNGLRVTFSFISKNGVFVGLCCLFLVIAMAPSIEFFHESKRGEFVMPGRNVGTAEKSTLAISMDHVRVGDLMSQGYFDKVFENHNRLSSIDFFVPYFFFLVCILSVINPLTRSTVFLAGNVLFLGILCVTDTSRIYAFLYEHVFLFKYMRMMSFLFWTSVFPLAILFAMSQLDIFLDNYQKKKNIYSFIFVIAAHLVFGAWVLTRGGVVWTSWIAMAASLSFFLGVMSGWRHSKALLGVLCMAIMVQPIQMIGYIVKNDAPSKEALAMPRYSSERRFSFRQKERSKEYLESEAASRPEGGIYCGTKWSQDLSVNVPGNIKMAFTANTLYLMDNTQIYDDVSSEFFLKLGQKWAQRRNLVFLSDDKAIHQDARSLSGKKTAESVDENSTSVKVVYFTPNTLELRTALDRPRFLLWVDNYHSGWHVFINGREERLFRADHTFKGVWLPSGKSDILFRFEKPLTYLWRYFVWFSFLLALGVVVFLAIRERSCMDEQKAVS